MITPRENFFKLYHEGKPEYTPLSTETFDIVGILSHSILMQPNEHGVDPFGTKWRRTPEGDIPDNTQFMLEEMSDWREVIHFPDLDLLRPAVEKVAAFEASLGRRDPEKRVSQLIFPTGIFDRMTAFMGFENALIALALEPEACKEFAEAYADYRIKCAQMLIDIYKPDIWVEYDDIATARGLFMSPETWREIIKPAHSRIVKAVLDKGVIFEQHVCGLAEDVIEDYIEMGATMWHCTQIMNDIPGILEKYQGKIIIEGGWDSSGISSRPDATADDLRKEVRRCMSSYGIYDNYILMPLIYNERGNAQVVGDDRFPAICDEWKKCVGLD